MVDTDALVAALQSGHLGGAGIDVFPVEPTTESPLFGLPGVVVTPHLGASTEEAQDRAGVVVAEQVAAALTGGVVTSAVNIPSVGPEALAVLGPFLPLAKQLGQLITALTGGPSPLEISYEGDLANLDTRMLTSTVLAGVLSGRVEEAVNVVNAASLAAERGIEWSEIAIPRARDYTNRLTVRSGDVSLSGTTVGTTSRPRLVSAFGEDIDIELAPHIGLFRYLDIPGQIGRVGTILGLANINIASMAVSRSRREGGAVMAVTVDSPVSSGRRERDLGDRRVRPGLVRGPGRRPALGPWTSRTSRSSAGSRASSSTSGGTCARPTRSRCRSASCWRSPTTRGGPCGTASAWATPSRPATRCCGRRSRRCTTAWRPTTSWCARGRRRRSSSSPASSPRPGARAVAVRAGVPVAARGGAGRGRGGGRSSNWTPRGRDWTLDLDRSARRRRRRAPAC